MYTVTYAPFLSETMNPKQMFQILVKDENGNIEMARTADNEIEAQTIVDQLKEQYSGYNG